MTFTTEVRTCRACLGEMTPFRFSELFFVSDGWVCLDCGRVIYERKETELKVNNRKENVVAMYQNGFRQCDIASRLHISDRQVRRIIASEPGIKMGRDISKHLNTGREYDLWFAEYLSCKNQAKVAQMFGVSRARVCQVIKDHHHKNYAPKLSPEMEIVANAT